MSVISKKLGFLFGNRKSGCVTSAKIALAILAPIFLFIFVFSQVSASSADSFTRNLKLGDSGLDVQKLQTILNSDTATQVSKSGVGSPGNETLYFGALTKQAVIRFQEKYAAEVLAPAGLSKGTGFVGANTIKKLNVLLANGTINAFNQAVKMPSSGGSSTVVTTPVSPKSPVVYSVSPDKVSRGDVVTIKGANFTPTNNSVTLKDGPAQSRFDGLPSYDGQTLTFVYEPPNIKVMTETEIRAMPANIVNQIEGPIKAAGKTLADALKSYSAQGITSESQLDALLQKNGHKIDDLYNFFFVKVENSQGNSVSQTALLHGAPKIISDITDAKSKPSLFSIAGENLANLWKSIVPSAYAQMSQNGGGFFMTVMICTCGDGYMDFVMDYSGAGSGLWVFSWGFMADAGFGFGAGNWIGGYQMMSGQCSIYIGVDCLDIPASEPENPWGSSM